MTKLAINGGTPVRTRPFPKWPFWDKAEIQELLEVIGSSVWGIGGVQVPAFEKAYAHYHEAAHGILVNSGTTGLEIALKAAGIGPGDEVLVPAYTFVATASAVLTVGATVRFVDIDPETYNMDPAKIEAEITPAARAVLPVDFAGRPADYDAILKLSAMHNLLVIEDAAQAWGAEWKGKKVGALGLAGMFSFQSSKNITSGEAGIILTNDDGFARLARSYINCGRVEGGPWYEHHYAGGNYRPTEFQAAVLKAQLNRYEPLLKKRERNARYLDEQLAGIKGIGVMRLDPRITRQAYHLYIFRYNQEAFGEMPKQTFLNTLRAEGIPASGGYGCPLYKQPLFVNRAFGPKGAPVDVGIDYTKYDLPVSEKACAEEAVWLNQETLLGETADMADIVEAIVKIQKNV
ncbi:L-glutamine:2-deoxy-scyllo-inosose aminotransferase [bacterium BMS3Bbin03]|nr:L-glutamine:2-deoxy-scyllo-inosose aminotransferase [bacterium BMS3Bbin03]